MAVRLREADNIAAMAELQQQISELEIQVNIVFLVEITTQSLPLRPSRFSQTQLLISKSHGASCTQIQHICTGFSLNSSGWFLIVTLPSKNLISKFTLKVVVCKCFAKEVPLLIKSRTYTPDDTDGLKWSVFFPAARLVLNEGLILAFKYQFGTNSCSSQEIIQRTNPLLESVNS